MVLSLQLTLLTENSLGNFHFSKKYIIQITRNSDLNKAHGMICSILQKLFGTNLRKRVKCDLLWKV